MLSIQGTYFNTKNESVVVNGNIFVINGNEYMVTPLEKQHDYYTDYIGILNDNVDDYVVYVKDGEIISFINGEHDTWETKELLDKEKRKTQNEVEKEQIKENKEQEQLSNIPKIGMTADEAKETNWGEPNKINKTTYSWGVTEQWCYSHNRYIYLEDGIVTAISE